DRLGCINELDWDASGRYLLTVEDSRGCLNPQAIHGLPGLYARTIRLWDLDVPPGTSAAPTTVRNAISRLGYSPVTIDPTGSVFLFQLPGGVVRFDINHQDQAQALYGFYLASTLFDGTNISPRGTYVVGAQLNLAGTELHAAVSRMDGTGPVSVLADPAARLSFAFDPLERVVAAVVPGIGVEFFDPADGHERIELRRSISPDPSDLVLGRPLDGSGNRVDRAFVSHCSNADCTGATTVSFFDWSDPAAQPEQLAVVDKPLVGVTDVSPGGRYLTVEWYAPHELDHGFTLNTLVLDPLTGATLQDVFGRVAMFSAPDERFVVGQEIDAQLNATDQRLTVRAGVWDLGLPGGATAGTGTLVLSETNVEVTPAPDRRSVAVFPTSYPVTASQDQPVAIWTLDESATDPVARTLPGTKGTAHSVAFDGAGHLVGIGETASALLWDVAGRPYETLDLEAPTAVLRTATNRDATMRALTRDGTTLILRHLDPAHHAHTDVNGPALPLVGAEQIDWLSFSPDGSLLFVNFHDPSKENSAQRHYPSGSVVVTIATGAVSRRFPEELVTSSGDGTRLAFRERNAVDPLRTNGIVVRTADDLKDEWRVDVSALPEDDVAAASSVYALDWYGGKLAGTNGSAKAVVWSRGDPGYRRFDPGSEAVARVAFFGVAFSSDGTRLALTTPDRRVRLYDLTTSATEPKVVQRLSPFAGGRVKFSDDGEMLLVDGIYLMDGHSLELIGPRLHPDAWNDPSKDLGTNATFFTRDGQYVVAERGDDSQSVRWAVGVKTLRTHACSIAARNLTRDEAEQFRLGSKSLSRCPFPVAGG
ncbi:MAG: hypothetical protein QOJ71_1426, partial [Actinomycetota bacterium]|nr:hypothetical protein [Actinomycetota bacterium]